MTSNLLIAYPSVLRKAISITGTADYQANRPLKNIVTGGRSATARVSPPDFGPVITITMDANNKQAIEYMIVAKAHLLKKMNATKFYVKISNPMSEVNAIGTLTGFQSRTFLGPKSEDLIFTSEINNQISNIFPTTAAQTFRVFYGSDATLPPEENPYFVNGHMSTALRNADAENYENNYWNNGHPAENLPQFSGYEGGDDIDANWQFSKLYMGMFFDFGRDPLYPISYTRDYTKSASERRPHREFTLTWKGVSNAKVTEFEAEIVRYMDVNPVFLYTRTNHATLQGARLLHAQVKSYKCRMTAPNHWQVDVVFTELL